MTTETTPSIGDLDERDVALLRRLYEFPYSLFSPVEILRLWNLSALDDSIVDNLLGDGRQTVIVSGDITERGEELYRQAVAESSPEVTG